MKFKTYNAFNRITPLEKENVANFLFNHLEEYKDSKSAIVKSIDYTSKETIGLGGYVFTLEVNQELVGVLVVNKTGMEEYIPENILVYLAIHHSYRRKGYGTKLLEQAIKNCNGSIALHVNADNPARALYEKLGFTTPYLEMRLER
jgi:ribosomal protein S18 acetylase RimI-like enzyme